MIFKIKKKIKIEGWLPIRGVGHPQKWQGVARRHPTTHGVVRSHPQLPWGGPCATPEVGVAFGPPPTRFGSGSTATPPKGEGGSRATPMGGGATPIHFWGWLIGHPLYQRRWLPPLFFFFFFKKIIYIFIFLFVFFI
jgi:hypothetical protein